MTIKLDDKDLDYEDIEEDEDEIEDLDFDGYPQT